MYQDNAVGVVIPAYNEEGFVGDVIETVPAFVDAVYVVDDASTDGTWAEIQRHAAGRRRPAVIGDGGVEPPRVVPIRHDDNRGVGGAIKTGYRRAFDDGMDVVTVLAGDGQMDPDMLERVIDPVVIGDAEYAKGNRLLSGDDRTEMPRFRYVGNVLLTYLTRVASGYWGIGDPQNGYTAISRTAFEAVDTDRLYDRYGFANDLLVALNVRGLRVVDVSTPAKYGDEESHISLSTFVPRVSKLLLDGFLRRLREKYATPVPHPVAISYALGALACLAAPLTALPPADGGVGSAAVALAVGCVWLLTAMALDVRSNRHLTGVVSSPTGYSSD